MFQLSRLPLKMLELFEVGCFLSFISKKKNIPLKVILTILFLCVIIVIAVVCGLSVFKELDQLLKVYSSRYHYSYRPWCDRLFSHECNCPHYVLTCFVIGVCALASQEVNMNTVIYCIA